MVITYLVMGLLTCFICSGVFLLIKDAENRFHKRRENREAAPAKSAAAPAIDEDIPF